MLDRVAEFFAGSTLAFTTEDGSPVQLVARQPTGVTIQYVGLTVVRQLAFAPPESRLNPGALVVDKNGTRFLLGAWPSDIFLGQVVARQFVLLECNARLAWTRLVHNVDPISGLAKIEGQEPQGNIWVVSERQNREPSAGAFDSYARRIICSAEPQPGDSLGDHMVKHVERTQGLVVVDVA